MSVVLSSQPPPQPSNHNKSLYLTTGYLSRMSEIVFELHETIECSLQRSEQVLEQAFLSYEQQFVSNQSSNNNLMDTTKLKHKLNLLVLERLQALQQIHTTFFEPLSKMTEEEQQHEFTTSGLDDTCSSSRVSSNQTKYHHHNHQEPISSEEELELNAMIKIHKHLKIKLSKTFDLNQQQVLKQDIQKVEREIRLLESSLDHYTEPHIEETMNILSQIIETPIIQQDRPPLTSPKNINTNNNNSNNSKQIVVSIPIVPPIVNTEKKQEDENMSNNRPLQRPTPPLLTESIEHSGYWSNTSSLSTSKGDFITPEKQKKKGSPSPKNEADLNSQLFESMIFDSKSGSTTSSPAIFNDTIHEQSSIMMCDDSQIITSDSDSDNEMYDHIFLTSQFLTKYKNEPTTNNSTIHTHPQTTLSPIKAIENYQPDYRTPIRGEEVHTPTIKEKVVSKSTTVVGVNSRPSLLKSPKTPQKSAVQQTKKTNNPSSSSSSTKPPPISSSMSSDKRPKPVAYRRASNNNTREPPHVPNHLGLSTSIRLAIPSKK